MAAKVTPTTEVSMLAQKIAAMKLRRIALKGSFSANVLATTYYRPTAVQADAILVSLATDPDWSNEIAQEAISGSVAFVYRKRNLSAGEQPTFIRFGMNAVVKSVVLTVIGTGSPKGIDMSTIALHVAAAAESVSAKSKNSAKADREYSAAFAEIGF